MGKVLNSSNKQYVIELLNDGDQKEMFLALKDNIQVRVLNSAFRKAGKLIIDQARTNFNATKKNKSLTNYSEFDEGLKMQQAKTKLGIKIGMQHREGYKYRFLNYGTADRFYKISSSKSNTKGTAGFYASDKTTHNTGVIKPNKFFTNAVEQKGDEAQTTLNTEIVNVFEKTVARYFK